MKRIALEWEEYRAMSIAPAAGPTQVRECQKAFYAGALVMHSVTTGLMDPGPEPTDADIARLDDLIREVVDFCVEAAQDPPGPPAVDLPAMPSQAAVLALGKRLGPLHSACKNWLPERQDFGILLVIPAGEAGQYYAVVSSTSRERVAAAARSWLASL